MSAADNIKREAGWKATQLKEGVGVSYFYSLRPLLL
jgi:hypothetical protein